MKNVLFVIVFVCISIVIYAQDNFDVSTSNDMSIQWLSSLEEAIDKSVESDMPIMLNIGLDGSEINKLMTEKIFSNDSVIYLVQSFIPLKLDIIAQREEAKQIIDKYNITTSAYFIFIDKDENVLSRLFGDEEQILSSKKLLTAMEEALETSEMIPLIKESTEPTIEALDYYIKQSDAAKAYQILSQTYEDKLIHSIKDIKNVYSISEKEYAFYIFDIADIYLYQKRDYKNAQKIYMDLSIYSPSQTEYIRQADINIIRMFDMQGDKEGMKDYINNTVLKRKNIGKDYKTFFENILNKI